MSLSLPDSQLGRSDHAPAGFDIDGIRNEFPILQQQINGHPLAYLDSAASAQRPVSVINAMRTYY